MSTTYRTYGFYGYAFTFVTGGVGLLLLAGSLDGSTLLVDVVWAIAAIALGVACLVAKLRGRRDLVIDSEGITYRDLTGDVRIPWTAVRGTMRTYPGSRTGPGSLNLYDVDVAQVTWTDRQRRRFDNPTFVELPLYDLLDIRRDRVLEAANAARADAVSRRSPGPRRS